MFSGNTSVCIEGMYSSHIFKKNNLVYFWESSNYVVVSSKILHKIFAFAKKNFVNLHSPNSCKGGWGGI